jgi:AP-2 complex subunit alpha
MFPETKNLIYNLFDENKSSIDVELQQRASEYFAILNLLNEDIISEICREMPPFKQHNFDHSNDRINESNQIIKKHEIRDTNENIYAPTEENYDSLVLETSGLLFEDKNLQIIFNSEYMNQKGQIAIGITNKSEKDLNDFKIVIPEEQDDLLFQLQTIVPTELQKNSKHVQLLSVECQNPFIKPIYMNIANITLKLPIIITKFIRGINLDPQSYNQRWAQLSQNEVQYSSELKIKQNELKHRFTKLGFFIHENIDPIADNIIVAGIFSCISLGNVGILARVEVNKEYNAYRVSVRSTNADVSKCLINVFGQIF